MNLIDSEQFTQRYGDTVPVAIIGAGCRFPHAASVFEFWRRIADGEELISRFDGDDLQRAGVDPALLLRPDYVPAAAIVAEAERFEWAFFGYSRQEAESIDPQQRLFLMCAWDALEMAGYPSDSLRARTGVIGASRMSTWQLAQRQDAQHIASPQVFQKLIGNDKDYLATRTAYKLGLRGPAYTVQTACSSSLIAVHLACEAIASGDARMMLAGGASLSFPQQSGYFYREGMIFSADGHCRPFDAAANGTLPGNGAAVVLLKRLDHALEDGDAILSVIRGTAINNDGSDKAGFTAPSLSGQREVIQDALAMADVGADTIGLVEAHGTATPLGDPIEVSALTEAWASWSPQPQQTALGSLKSNTGHLDTAAGIGSLLKAGLALWQQQIPPSLNFDTPNPAIDFARTPFYVPQQLQPWRAVNAPLRAAVSSFGIGGSNAHAILEAAPDAALFRAADEASATLPAHDDKPLMLLLSARSEASLWALASQHLLRLSDREASFDARSYAATSFYHRTLFSHRLLISASDADGWIAHLLNVVEQLRPETVEGDDGVVLFAAGELPEALLAEAALKVPQWDRWIAPITQRALLPVSPFDGEHCAPAAIGSLTQNASAVSAEETEDGWLALCKQAAQTAHDSGTALDLSLLGEEERCVDALHQHYVTAMLRQIPLLQQPQSFFTVSQLMQAGNIPPRYADLMRRLLRDLAQSGAIKRRQQDGEWLYGELTAAATDVDGWLTRMRKVGYQHLADLISRTGPQLGAMLRGEVDPVSIVFPAASTADVEHMYQEQPWSRYFNQIAAQALAALASKSSQPLTILEVGGGTGGTTHDVLHALPPGSCEHYSFTDLGPLFLQRAREKFAAWPFLEYVPFDMEKPAAAQHLPRQRYDAIVAANVLHNAADLRQMLRNLASLLKPGGILLMREITAPKKLFDFVFGALVPPISDTAQRHDELFASEQDWRAALSDAGFVASDAFPAADLPAAALGEQILLARTAQSIDRATHDPLNVFSVEVPADVQQPDGMTGWSQAAILQAALTALSPQRPSRLCQLHWHNDPSGAGNPLRITLQQREQRVDAQVEGIPLFSASLLPSRVPGVESAPWPGDLLQPWRQQGELYRWQWQKVTPSQSSPARSIIKNTVPDSEDRQQAFFSELQQQLAAADPAHALLLLAEGIFDPSGKEHPAAWLPGFLTVARHEYPQLSIGLLDIAGLPQKTPDDEECRQIVNGGYGQLRWHEGGWQTPVLQPVVGQGGAAVTPGCHVLTGGLSPLGMALMKDLVSRGVKKLVLLTRREPDEPQQRQLADLVAQGAEIIIDSDADASSESAFGAALERLAQRHLPIGTVWHLAGAVNDMPIARLTWSQLQQGLATRLNSARMLDRWQARLRPQQSVWFSSAATVLGPQGQAVHAAACGALEMLAQQRCARGDDTLAIAWGYWQITESVSAKLADHLADSGMAPLETATALALLQTALAGEHAVVAAMRVDWRTLAKGALSADDMQRFSAFLPQSPAAPVASAAAETETETPQAEQLERYLRETLSRQLNCPPEQVTLESNLVQLGLDSLLFLDLNETLGRDLGVKLNAESVFRAGNVRELIASLQQEMQAGTDSDSLLRRALAELESAQAGWLDSRGDVTRQAASGVPLPLTPLQRLRWQQHQHAPRLLYVEYDKPHDFPLTAFVQGWQRLQQRHPMLRAAITAQGEITIVNDAPTVEMQYHDWQELASDALLAQQQSLRETLSNHAFDLQAPPQVVLATSQSRQGYRLHIVLNTLLVDIESFRVLLRELDSLIHQPDVALPERAFTPQDYHNALLALANTPAASYPAPELPAPPALPWQPAASPTKFAIWRDALPAGQWLRLKARGEQQDLSGSDLLLAAWGLVLRDWITNSAFTLRLDFTDRLPLHPHASQLIADATTIAPVPLDLSTATDFTGLARQAARHRQQHLTQHLPGVSHEADWLASLPVAFTSLLGVRQAYSIPETSDPLLGMPGYEYAAQPLTPLHLQALEEESALLFNIDVQCGALPDEMGEIALITLRQLLETLSEVEEAWLAPLTDLLPVDEQIVALAQQTREAKP